MSERVPRWLAWLRERDLRMVAGVCGVAALVWGFVEIAERIRGPSRVPLDDRILIAFRDAADPATAIGPRWLEDVVRDVSALGGPTIVTTASVGVVGYLLLAREPRAAFLVVVAVAGGALLGSILKTEFVRPRPSVVPHMIHVTSLSFPSGHSMVSAIFYPTLGALLARVTKRRRIKAYIMFVALSIAILVGLSRIYLGVHYPTDVLAGWTVGFAWALACGLIARALQRRGAIEHAPAGESAIELKATDRAETAVDRGRPR